MATRKSAKLKEAVFATLTADATLQTLLGGAGRIRYGAPDNNSVYPCVCYYPITEVDNIYNIDQIEGNVVLTAFILESFSDSSSPLEGDAIDDQIYAILNGANISDSDNLVYLIERKTKSQFYDPDVRITRTQSRYHLQNHSL